jgi:uroporphyrinogen-III synthase
MGRTVWITRTQPGADMTAARVRALGFQVVVEPLFEVLDRAAELDLSEVGALAFTSANAVRALVHRTTDRTLRVFAVGDATALAARTAGFRNVLSTRGDVSSLVEGIASRKRDLVGPVLHPGGADLAGDLVGDLNAAGVPARSVTLYETVERTPPDTFWARLPAIEDVLVHSPRGAQALAGLLKAHPAPHLRALCLSRAVSQPLTRARTAGRLAGVVAARLPTEEDLLQLLRGPVG